MKQVSGSIELWRRFILVAALIIGIGMFFYVTPAVISVTAVDWHKEQVDELKSMSGYVTSEEKRLSKLPLSEYIDVKTEGKVTDVDAGKWKAMFQQIKTASGGEYGKSSYGNRVSDKDKEVYWKSENAVPVFFKPSELPYSQWGLSPYDGKQAYISVNTGDDIAYFVLKYENYQTSLTAMYKPYRVAPKWMYHPFRTIGIGVIVAGLLIYILLPRRKRNPEDIAYGTGNLVAGDIVALIILLTFYSLPFLINGGTMQAITGMWQITLIMWGMCFFGLALFYYSAWYASYRIEITPEALYLITFKGVTECPFSDMVSADMVSLRNPKWFRKLFLVLSMISLVGGRNSVQSAGSAILAATAAYGGLELSFANKKPIYIWFTDQRGAIIVPNFHRVPDAIRAAGIRINEQFREIEGFSMFM